MIFGTAVKSNFIYDVSPPPPFFILPQELTVEIQDPRVDPSVHHEKVPLDQPREEEVILEVITSTVFFMIFLPLSLIICHNLADGYRLSRLKKRVSAFLPDFTCMIPKIS